MSKEKLHQIPIMVYIVAASVLLRCAAALYLGDKVVDLPGTADQISYHTLALRVLGGHGFSFGTLWWPGTAANAPTAHWSFLYTFFLMAVYALFGPHPLAARLIQAVLVGLLQPYFAYLVGSQLFGRTVGLVTAALTAFYAYFVYYAANLMTESFYITAILGALYLAIRLVQPETSPENSPPKSRYSWMAVGLGLSLGAAILFRQVFLLCAPFLFLWMWWAARRKQAASPIPAIAISSVLIVLMILPFSIYNTRRFGHFVLLNTNAGYAFYWANMPVYGTQFEGILPANEGGYIWRIPSDLRHLDEASLDTALLKQGIQFVISDPRRYFLLSLSRIPVYFMFWPSSQSEMISNIARVSSFGVLWPFMLYGLIFAFARRKSSLLDGLASPPFLIFFMAVVYSAIHLLSWSLIRYRLPVDAVLLIFAGYALVDLAQRLGIKRPQFRNEIPAHGGIPLPRDR